MKTTCLLVPLLFLLGPAETVLWEESFDGRLQPDWQWVREDAAEWRIRENKLEVRSQPGRIWSRNDAKNLLLRTPPAGDELAATVTVAHEPKGQWEQAGLVWYVDDDRFVKLISEHIDGEMYVVTGCEQQNRQTVLGKVKVPSANLQLRLLVQGRRVTGQWRLQPGDAWSDAGSVEFVESGRPRVGVFTEGGPAEEVRWVRFDDFAISAPGR